MYTAVSLKARISWNYKERVWLLKLYENSVKLPALFSYEEERKLNFRRT
jgi:hypothetical protein